jgi:Tol biopolymer transport system component/predicted Ser/Thr protein kinase
LARDSAGNVITFSKSRRMSPQQSIAHYRIVSKLGEGGMGAVYRATDTKLNRDVAIKVLPAAFAQDTMRMQRFEREAQVLASLNHPNIAAIYGVEHGAIVMELVEGRDLAGPLPVDTVIDYARQIAAGLEAAHEKGVVHRDLKPANIKVTAEGVVKLLDFGLAKAREEGPVSAPGASPTISPTLSLAMTQAGMILGTAAYMSPEQARGKLVDRRTDIWAFGVILYELLTGRHPYGVGETVTDTLASIVLKEANLDALPKDTPPRLRRLIERCLRKDPKMRLRDIGDARVLLDEPEEEVARPAEVPRRAWLPWAVAAAGLAIAAGATGLAWFRGGAPEAERGAVHFTIPLPKGTTWPVAAGAPQWVPSPDGRNLAIVAGEGATTALWVRPMNAAAARRLEQTEGANYPFWSPDGQSIGFFTEGALRRVPVSGGASVKICDVQGGNGGAWNRGGVIVFAGGGGALQRVSATGGTPAAATTLEKDETVHHWPQFLDDGRHFLYEARGAEGAGAIYVQELGSPKRVRVQQSSMRAAWAPPGYLLFSRESSLLAQRMNPRTFQLEGEPAIVADAVQSNASNGRSTFTVSGNGVLAYRAGSGIEERQVTWRDREGKILQQVGKPILAASIAPSPDGKSAALVISNGGPGDAWLMDLATGVLTPLIRDVKFHYYGRAVWSPDSKRLILERSGGGLEEITVGSGHHEVLTQTQLSPVDWSLDGGAILCSSASSSRLSLLSMTPGHALQTLATTPYQQQHGRFSPDGRYIAYESTESGSLAIFVAAFPSLSGKRRVSPGGGTVPVWSKDGKKLYYRAENGSIAEVEIRTSPELVVGKQTELFRFGAAGRINRFGVSEDGQRFLIADLTTNLDEALEVNVVVDWTTGLKR